MRLGLAALLVASLTGLPRVASAAPGLGADVGDSRIVHPAPRLFLAAGEGILPTGGTEAVVWSGSLSIPRSGEFQFFVSGGALSVDGRQVGEAPVRLEAGQRAFQVRQPQRIGPLRLAVDWSGPGFEREPIPARFFSHPRATPRGPDGRRLFEDLGCSNCHRSDSPSLRLRPGPVLTGVGARIKPAWLERWLAAPGRVSGWATMPQLLGAGERADVAAFLRAQTAGAAPEPRRTERDVERGRTIFQSFGCAACHGDDLPLAGLGAKTTVGNLQRYLLDPLRFSPSGRMPSFRLSEREALQLAAYLATLGAESTERTARDGDPARGRELTQSSGCLACHQLDGLESDYAAPDLRQLNETGGCLADAVPAGLPRYRLDGAERDALRRFVGAYRATPDVVAAPTFDLARRMEQLRCGACHSIAGEPPTGALAEAAPPLTDVGAKLRAESLEQAIGSGTRILDWQELRMPTYRTEDASWLASALAKASGIAPGTDDDPELSGDAKTGLSMLGMDGSQGGLGCVGCHGWRQFAALGENGPNLFETGRRLRRDWFLRWMRGPERILAGTSMPNYFGAADPARARLDLANLWAAFRSSAELPLPVGFQAARASLGDEAMPVPGERAIVVRWDMPEATPASIAVGLPDGVSYCFDAGEARLRYAWRGGFLDLSPTLLSKKNRETNRTETARIVGEIFFREGPYPIRVGDRRRIPQRRFRGYRLIDSFPEFRYEVDGIEVRERILPIQGGLVRRFRLEKVDRPMWFVPAAAAEVEIRSTLPANVIPRGEGVAFEVTVVAAR